MREYVEFASMATTNEKGLREIQNYLFQEMKLSEESKPINFEKLLRAQQLYKTVEHIFPSVVPHTQNPPQRPPVIIDLITELSIFAEKWHPVWFPDIASGKFKETSKKLFDYREKLIEVRTRAFRTVKLSSTIDIHIQEFEERVRKLADSMSYLEAVGQFQVDGGRMVETANTILIPEIEKEYPA